MLAYGCAPHAASGFTLDGRTGPANPVAGRRTHGNGGIETVESHSLTGPVTPGLGIFGPGQQQPTPFRMEVDMQPMALHHWIVVLACAYMEYTYTPWDGRNYYRRTVDYGRVVWC